MRQSTVTNTANRSACARIELFSEIKEFKTRQGLLMALLLEAVLRENNDKIYTIIIYSIR
ncbi:hypothetical protein GQX74_011252 [Glossina fuscipes]|nr:hypothetical protein GQX74_011252 [Glossina fuscipes]